MGLTTVQRVGRALPMAALTALLSAGSLNAQSEQRQLKDLFDLQWMLYSRGRPEEITVPGPGQLTTTVGVPFYVTTNPQSIPSGGSADAYFCPWLAVEWRKALDERTSWYLGSTFINYQYLRFPELNTSYGEVSTGVDFRLAGSKRMTLDAYAAAAFDCNLDARFQIDDFEPGASVGLIFDADLGRGHSVYLTPDLSLLGAFPQSSFKNSYLAETVTAGWTWQATRTLMFGAYWSGSANHYPQQFDFTQYAGVNLDWQVASALVVNLACIQTWNMSSDSASRYTDFSAAVTLRTHFPLRK
jgi:hypothetical protein